MRFGVITLGRTDLVGSFAVLALLALSSVVQSSACAGDREEAGRLFGARLEPILLEVELNGSRLKFALDSSASHTFVNRKHSKLLGLGLNQATACWRLRRQSRGGGRAA